MRELINGIHKEVEKYAKENNLKSSEVMDKVITNLIAFRTCMACEGVVIKNKK